MVELINPNDTTLLHVAAWWLQHGKVEFEDEEDDNHNIFVWYRVYTVHQPVIHCIVLSPAMMHAGNNKATSLINKFNAMSPAVEFEEIRIAALGQIMSLETPVNGWTCADRLYELHGFMTHAMTRDYIAACFVDRVAQLKSSEQVVVAPVNSPPPERASPKSRACFPEESKCGDGEEDVQHTPDERQASQLAHTRSDVAGMHRFLSRVFHPGADGEQVSAETVAHGIADTRMLLRQLPSDEAAPTLAFLELVENEAARRWPTVSQYSSSLMLSAVQTEGEQTFDIVGGQHMVAALRQVNLQNDRVDGAGQLQLTGRVYRVD